MENWQYVPEIERRFDPLTGERTPDRCLHWIKSGDKSIALVCDHGDGKEPSRASLMAAAPDLLSALKDVFKMMDEQILVRNIEHDHKPEWAGLMMGVVTRLKFAHDAIKKAEGKERA